MTKSNLIASNQIRAKFFNSNDGSLSMKILKKIIGNPVFHIRYKKKLIEKIITTDECLCLMMNPEYEIFGFDVKLSGDLFVEVQSPKWDRITPSMYPNIYIEIIPKINDNFAAILKKIKGMIAQADKQLILDNRDENPEYANLATNHYCIITNEICVTDISVEDIKKFFLNSKIHLFTVAEVEATEIVRREEYSSEDVRQTNMLIQEPICN